MNERIKQLAKRAGLGETNNGEWYPLPVGMEHIKRFAELVRQDEREARLVILETYPTVLEMIKAIRGRTE